MQQFTVVLFVVAISGCAVFSGQKTTSGWATLDKSESVKCSRWPLREKDLAIDEIFVVGKPAIGFLATGVKRDGSPLRLFATFNGDTEVEKSSLRELPLGRSAIVAGGFAAAGMPMVTLLQNEHVRNQNKAVAELRTVADNIVRFKVDLTNGIDVISGELTTMSDSTWLAFRRENGGHAILRFAAKGAGKISATTVSDVSFDEAPALIQDGSGQGILAIRSEHEARQPFWARSISQDGAASSEQRLEFSIASQLESWSVVNHEGRHYLAVIDGDSLIGQAQLRVAALKQEDERPMVAWIKDLPLKDVHVTEPVFLPTATGLQVLLLKWVDEESTIARYNLAGDNLSQPSYSGIFPKGARIVRAFAGADSDDAYVIVRHRDDTRWIFQICSI